MLIDAMRYDFIFEQSANIQDEKPHYEHKFSKHVRMPFVNRLLRESKAKPFKLNARPPTVTLPRIKVFFVGFFFQIFIKGLIRFFKPYYFVLKLMIFNI